MVLEKNVKTFWTRVSRIGETTSPQEEAWVDCKSYETRPKERILSSIRVCGRNSKSQERILFKRMNILRRKTKKEKLLKEKY